MNAVQKLRSMVGEIRTAKGPGQEKEAWELVKRLMGRMPVTAAEVERVCTARDIEGLDALITRIEAPAAPPQPVAAVTSAMSHDMEAAMNAFRKRLKLTRLSDESKLAGRRLTGGKKSEIDAIIPPTEFPPEVWKALVKIGKLTDTGQGFYALASQVNH